MVDKSLFLQGLIVLSVAVIGDLYILKLLFNEIRRNKTLLPVKWMMIGLMIFLITAAAPLMYVYADAIWNFNKASWILKFAVLGNAYSKLAIVAMLILIYKYRDGDDREGLA